MLKDSTELVRNCQLLIRSQETISVLGRHSISFEFRSDLSRITIVLRDRHNFADAYERCLSQDSFELRFGLLKKRCLLFVNHRFLFALFNGKSRTEGATL